MHIAAYRKGLTKYTREHRDSRIDLHIRRTDNLPVPGDLIVHASQGLVSKLVIDVLGKDFCEREGASIEHLVVVFIGRLRVLKKYGVLEGDNYYYECKNDADSFG